jgi:predicted DNA-binding transcriptional regulator AlpA
MDGNSDLADVLAWLESLPEGSLIPPACVIERLRGAGASFDGAGAATVPVAGLPPPASSSWEERIWSCHPSTRLNASQACEVLGKSHDALYKLTSRGSIPHSKIDGVLVFKAGELRDWIRDTEERVVESRPSLRGRLRVAK